MRMSFAQFSKYVTWCGEQMFAAQLQDVYLNKNTLVFEFYRSGTLWLVCELDPEWPQVVLLKENPPPKTKEVKPVILFIKSHGRNLRMSEFSGVAELGRVARLRLSSLVPGDEKFCLIEMQLIPHAANLLVSTLEKSIAWKPPREMRIVPENLDAQAPAESFADLAPDEIETEWRQAQLNTGPLRSGTKNGKHPGDGPDARTVKPSRAVEKKRKALEALGAELKLLEEGAPQTELVAYANAKASHLPIPPELKKHEKLSIDEAHARVKKLNLKRAGIRTRIEKIQDEISKLEISNQTGAMPPDKAFAVKQMQKAGASGRHLDLGDSISAVIGKSAQDNLDLLRKARPWDLWLHIKDYPGAHGLIFRNKGQTVSKEQVEAVFQKLLRESKNTRGLPAGVKLEVLMTECRFVRPIKGDHIGRVNFQNAQVFLFASKGS